MKEEKKAVALKYPGGASIPFITASAKGFFAQRMLEIAKENEIPITENPELADFLSIQEIGHAIPEETWEAVAKIFAFVVGLKKNEGNNGKTKKNQSE